MADKYSGVALARLWHERLNVTAELETVFEEAQIGDERSWSGGFDFGDDGLQSFALDGLADCSGEFLDAADGTGLRNAGGASDAFEVGAGARGRGESADGKETLVVKNDMEKIFRLVTRERA